MRSMLSTYRISGNTYPHREQLKAAGAKYDSQTQTWTILVRDKGFNRNDRVLVDLRRLGLVVEHA